MSEREAVIKSLRPLFREAREKGLWFHCPYQNLWFTPDELAVENSKDRFLWGAKNWTLRDPGEEVERLEKEKGYASRDLDAFKARIAKEAR